MYNFLKKSNIEITEIENLEDLLIYLAKFKKPEIISKFNHFCNLRDFETILRVDSRLILMNELIDESRKLKDHFKSLKSDLILMTSIGLNCNIKNNIKIIDENIRYLHDAFIMTFQRYLVKKNGDLKNE